MFRVSFIMAFIWALADMFSRAISRSRVAMREAASRKSGRMTILISVRRHSSVNITASTATACTMLVRMLMMVLLMAFCAPITSLFRRLISSPTLVWVKKRSDMRSRCSYSATRRSKITPSPTLAFSRRCTTLISPRTTGRTSSIEARKIRRFTSPDGIARSIRSRTISGLSRFSPETIRIRASIPTICSR